MLKPLHCFEEKLKELMMAKGMIVDNISLETNNTKDPHIHLHKMSK